MAFNINAQVILSGPKNIKAVTNKIQKQLGGITATVNLKVAKGTSRSVAALNRHVAALNKNLATLQGAATGANTALASLGTNLKAVNTGGSRFVQTQNKVNNSLKQTNSQLKEASYSMNEFGKESARAIKRFGAFTVATGTIFGFIRAVQTATKEALTFERELVKLEQITGRGGKALNEIRKSVDDLSQSLGIDANELLKIGKTFAQTGQTLDQVKRSMEAVARASLAPTFGTMASTTEGLVAAMAQFNIKAADSEKVLGSLNAVSKKFAVESSDLISVIRRAGGVFAATATQMKNPIESLNELIAIFTSVRSTTRETADTIATGLRTIFSRIQRPRTIEFLKQYGVELLDLQGNFIGTFKAFQALSTGLDSIIKRGDVLTLAKITEELGGIRQVGKLIPAIKNFNKSLEALEVARAGAFGGLQKDVELALKPLGKQFERVSAQFNTLIRDVSQSRSFQQFARVALETASALISVADALRPLIPLITTLASIRIARGAFGFAQGFVSEFRGGGGAVAAGGRLGGAVTGSGSPQQVATQQNATRAMSSLSAALKTNSSRLGTNSTALSTVGANLRVLTGRVNDLIIALRFRGGGGGGSFFLGGGGGPRGGNPPGSRGRRGPLRPLMRARRFAAGGRVGGTVAGNLTSASLQKKVYRGDLDDKLLSGRAFNAEDRFNSAIQYKPYAGRIPQGYVGRGRRLNSKQFERYVSFMKTGGVRALAKSPTAPIDIPSVGTEVKNYADIGNIGKASIRDKVIRALKGPGMQPDFQGIGTLKKNWKVRSGNRKWTAGADQISIPDVEVAYPNSNAISRTAAGRIGLTRKARGLRSGGNVFQPQGTDTVPAMLTPGEFVINRQSAERIGYGNLSDMNRLAKGGVARSSKTQYFANGTTGSSSHAAMLAIYPPSLVKNVKNVDAGLGAMSSKLGLTTSLLAGLGITLTSADFSSFTNFINSIGSTLGLSAALYGPQILQTFSGMAAEGGKVAGMLSKFKGIGTVGLGAGIAAMVADPIVKGIVGSIAGSQEERIKGRVPRGAAGVGDAALVGGIEGALTKAVQGGAIGAAIGNTIVPGIGGLVGGVLAGGLAAIEGAISGANLEAALQNQATTLSTLDFTSKQLDQRFQALVNSGGDLTRNNVDQLRSLINIRNMEERQRLNVAREKQEADRGYWESLFGDIDEMKMTEQIKRLRDLKGESRIGQGQALFNRSIAQYTDEKRPTLKQLQDKGVSTADFFSDQSPAGQTAALAALHMAIGSKQQKLSQTDDRGTQEQLANDISALRKVENTGVTSINSLIDQLSGTLQSEIKADLTKRSKEGMTSEVLRQGSLALSQRLETLKLAFEVLGKSIDQEIQQLDRSMERGAASIADLSSSVIEMRGVVTKNIITNLETSSGAEINKALEQVARVQGFVAGTPEEAISKTPFQGIQDILTAKQDMPDILREVVSTAASKVRTGKVSSDAAIAHTLKTVLDDKFPKGLPSEITQSIIQGLSTSIQRQENLAAGATPAEILQAKGGDIIRDAFASHDLMLESFSKVLDAIDKFKNGLLQVGNLQSKLVRQQINNQLEINRKRFDIEDRVNRVRGRSTRPGTARDRLMTQMSTVLGRDARGPNLAGRLAKERNRLEGERSKLEKDFKDAAVGTPVEKKAAAALRKNTDALNRNKQATDMLANDVTVLAELEQQASKATRKEQNAQAGILGFSEATDKLLSGTREGFEAFANFTAPINALIKASHNQILRPDEARGLVQGIQSGDPILSAFLDNLPGGENQAKELKQNLVRNLAQDTAMKLSMVGGAPGTYAQLLPMLEQAYTAALDRKTGIAGEMEAIGREQNRVLSDAMTTITNNAITKFDEMTANLNTTLLNIGKDMVKADERRGLVDKQTGLDRYPNIQRALDAVDKLFGADFIKMMFKEKKDGGEINKMAQGGYVRGPSHSAGGVMANLEGGEYVVPKKYAQGGVVYLQGGGGAKFVDEEKILAMREWHRKREEERTKDARIPMDHVPWKDAKQDAIGAIDSAVSAGPYTGQGALTKEQGEQQKKAFQAKLTKEKTVFGSEKLSRGLDTVGSAFSSLSHLAIGAGEGVLGGAGWLVGATENEWLRESKARMMASGQHAQNVLTLGDRFKHEADKDAFETLRGGRVEDEWMSWGWDIAQFMTELAPVPGGAIAKGVSKGANLVGKAGKATKLGKVIPRLGKGKKAAEAAAKAKTGPLGTDDLAKMAKSGAAEKSRAAALKAKDTVKVTKGQKSAAPVAEGGAERARRLRKIRAKESNKAIEAQRKSRVKEARKTRPQVGFGAAVDWSRSGTSTTLSQKLGKSSIGFGQSRSDLARAAMSPGREAARAKQVASIVKDPKVLKEAMGSTKGAKGSKDLSDLGEAVLKARTGMSSGREAARAKQVASIIKDPKVVIEAMGSMKGAKGSKGSELGEAVLKARKATGAGKAAGKAAPSDKLLPSSFEARQAAATKQGGVAKAVSKWEQGKNIKHAQEAEQTALQHLRGQHRANRLEVAEQIGKDPDKWVPMFSDKMADTKNVSMIESLLSQSFASSKFGGKKLVQPRRLTRHSSSSQVAGKAAPKAAAARKAAPTKESMEIFEELGLGGSKLEDIVQSTFGAMTDLWTQPVPIVRAISKWGQMLQMEGPAAQQKQAAAPQKQAAAEQVAIDNFGGERPPGPKVPSEERPPAPFPVTDLPPGWPTPEELVQRGAPKAPPDADDRERDKKRSQPSVTPPDAHLRERDKKRSQPMSLRHQRAAERRLARRRRLGLAPDAHDRAYLDANPIQRQRRGGGGIFGRIGQAIGNLFGSGRGRAGGGRGRGPAVPTPRGLTDKQKEDTQAERRARRKKRRQATLDSMEKQRKRRAAERENPTSFHSGATTTHGGGASGRESVSWGFGDSWDDDAPKSGRVSSEERVRRAGPMTGGRRVRRRGERVKPKTAAQLDREERESVAQSHRTQSAAHTAQTKAMQDQRNAAMDARRREEEALTNEILAKKGRDSTGKKINQQTVPEIRAANIDKINKRIATYKDVIAKQKAKGQDTRSAEGSLVKLNEELLALQKIGTQDAAHAAHLQQVGSRQNRVVRDPTLDPAPVTSRDEEVFGFGGHRPPKPTSHAEMQAAQQRGDFSMFTEDKPKLGKESDVFGFGDSEREKRMRARVQSEGDWRVGHRESMAGVRAEEKERQIDKFRRARGYALGGSIFKPKGTDTVPAMLTPGEFVINRKSAGAIGHDKLKKMNQWPPQGMAQGGVVQPQYLQGGGGVTEGADVAAKLAESQASMNKLSEALGKIPEVINIELKQNGIVKVALDEQFVPQVKKYFEQWASEKLNGAGRADDSNVDTSMHNTDNGGG